MGKALTATGLFVVTVALICAGCGGGSGSSTVAGSPTTSAKAGLKQQNHSHAYMINGNDSAFQAFCKAKSASERRIQLHAVVREILASPNAPAHVNVHQFAHAARGACAGPPKTLGTRG